MFARSLALVFVVGGLGAVGCVGSGDVAGDQATVSQNSSSGGGFTCGNKSLLDVNVVECVGSVAVLPIIVDVKDVRVLDDSELNILSDDLNQLSLKDIDVLDKNVILNDVGLTVFNDILNKFLINITKNDVDVCTPVALGLALCKSPS